MTLDKQLDEILNKAIVAEVGRVPLTPDRVVSMKIDYQSQIKHQLKALIEERERMARIGMVLYYDQVSNNEEMDWKGLFADNLKQLGEGGIEALQKGKS